MYIKEFYQQYYAPVCLANCKKSTADVYQQVLNLWIKHCGNSTIGEIKPELAGIPEHRRFAFHAIRKHFGSELAKENFAAVTKALGHSSPVVTFRYYMNIDQVFERHVKRPI